MISNAGGSAVYGDRWRRVAFDLDRLLQLENMARAELEDFSLQHRDLVQNLDRMIPAPKSWSRSEKDRWNEIWSVHVPKQFKNLSKLHYCTYISDSQSNYRPYYVHVWGLKDGEVKLFTMPSYGDVGAGVIMLEWDSTHYSHVTEISHVCTWVRAVAADFSWYYSGGGTPRGRKDKHRGKRFKL